MRRAYQIAMGSTRRTHERDQQERRIQLRLSDAYKFQI